MSQIYKTPAGGGGGGTLVTLSAEGNIPQAPLGGNFNFSGTPGGGYGSNGAIQFFCTAPGEMDAQVRVDGVTVGINGSNQLVAFNTSGLIWVVQAVNLTAVPGTGYFANSASIRPGGGLHVTLPSPASIGHTFAVYDFNSNGWFIIQSGTQTVRVGVNTSTPGTGTVFSANPGGGDTVTLVCADSTVGAEVWVAVEYDGNIGVI